MSPSTATCEYRCPGESYTISRSVHLARLAAYYPKCGSCPRNGELGAWEPPAIPLPIVHHPGVDLDDHLIPDGNGDESSGTSHVTDSIQDVRKPVFTREGVRGIYLNAMSRGTAAELSGAFAYRLWEQWMPSGRRQSVAVAETTISGKLGPTVVIAHDERPSSPDIVTGVGAALRRMGCTVIDVGLATRPGFTFAVTHLQADGGIFVTGAGCDPAWTGLDFVGRDSAPWSRGGELNHVRSRFESGFARPSRRPGSQRLFQATLPYEAGLWKHWHALRPLQIAFASPSVRVGELFERLFHKLACRLLPVATPVRGRSLSDPDDPDLARTAAAVRSYRAHLGLLVSEEGEACAFLDERGTLVPANQLLRILARQLCEQRATVTVVCESGPANDSQLVPIEANLSQVRWITASPTREGVWQAWEQHRADLAGGPSGRYWFDAPGPVCDAVVTVAHVLQALSHDDTPFSELAQSV